MALLILLWFTDIHRLEMTPFDFQDEEKGLYYLDGFDQMEFVGDDLFLFSCYEPLILRVNTRTREVVTIGGPGEGPGEFRNGPFGIAADKDGLWVIDSGRSRALLSFTLGGEYRDQLEIDWPGPKNPEGVSLGLSKDEIVIPISPESGFLAKAYRLDKTSSKAFGEPAIPKSAETWDLIKNVPNINRTFWTYHRGFWYGAFSYLPQIWKFDKALNLVSSYRVEHSLTMEWYAKILDFAPSPEGGNQAPTLITDMKIFKNRLFVMCAWNYLFEISLDSGEILSISQFLWQGSPKARPLFAFRDDGALFLGHPAVRLFYDNDLFQAAFPAIED